MPTAATRPITIAFDPMDKCITFAAGELQRTLECKGHLVTPIPLKALSSAPRQDQIVLITRQTTAEKSLLIQAGVMPMVPSTSQGYSIRNKQADGFTSCYVVGFDSAGAMIGGLDCELPLKAHGLDSIPEVDRKPYIKQRGIKFNVPLDARTPSYSDSGDSAQRNISNMWELDFWHEFLDEMARNRFNVLSLWNLHPFPSMVKVPSYPRVALDDVKQTTVPLSATLDGVGMSTPASLRNLRTVKTITINEKIRFWREVMQYAKDRGVGIYLFTWNIFVYGTEESGYGFTTSVEDSNTQDYFRKSVEALINTYPLLKGIGITAGENMSRQADIDEAWLFGTYGQGINDALANDDRRTFCLVHRIQMANIRKALGVFSKLHSRCALNTSFKYAQAHAYSSIKPAYIHAGDDAYLNDIGSHKTWLTIRDDDYYMLRGGSDAEFTRAFIKHLPCDPLEGFYIGPDGYTWGREYISKDPDSPRQQVIRKRWYSFHLWGRLAYDPTVPQLDFVSTLASRFPRVDAQKLFEAWAKASRIIPLVNRSHNKNCEYDFQWYPEACTSKAGFHDVNRFIESAPQQGEGLMSISDYAECVLNGCKPAGMTPLEASVALDGLAEDVLHLTKDMSTKDDKELFQTVADIHALAILGKYYSKKILGATNKCLAEKACDTDVKREYRNRAMAALREASTHWRTYAEAISGLYVPQALTRLLPESGSERECDVSRLQSEVDNDILILEGLELS